MPDFQLPPWHDGSDSAFEGRLSPGRAYSAGDWEKALDLTMSCASAGRHQEAIEYALQGVEIARAVFIGDDYRWGETYENLGTAYGGARKHTLAEESFNRALAVYERCNAAPRVLARVEHLLGTACWDSGDPERAERHARRCFELLERDGEASISLRLTAALSLSRALLAVGKVDDANRIFGVVFFCLDRMPPGGGGEAVEGLHALAVHCLERNLPHEAVLFGQRALQYAEASEIDQTKLVMLRAQFAEALYSDGQFDRALAIYNTALDAAKQAGTLERQFCDRLRVRMAQVLSDLGEPDRADRIVRKLLNAAIERGDEPPQQAQLALHAAQAAHETFNLPDAAEFAKLAAKIITDTLGPRWSAALKGTPEQLEEHAGESMQAADAGGRSTFVAAFNALAQALELQGCILASEAANRAESAAEELFSASHDLFAKAAVLAEMGHLTHLQRALRFSTAQVNDAQDGMVTGRKEWEALFESVQPQPGERPGLLYATALMQLGQIDLALENTEDGREKLQAALAAAHDIPVVRESIRIVPFLLALAEDSLGSASFQNAERYLERAQNQLERRGRREHPFMLRTLQLLIALHEARGRDDDLESLRLKAGAVFNQLDFLTDFRMFGEGPRY